MSAREWTIRRRRYGTARGWVAMAAGPEGESQRAMDTGAGGAAFLLVDGPKTYEATVLDDATFFRSLDEAQAAVDRHTGRPGRRSLDGGSGESDVVKFRAPAATIAQLDALVEDLGQDRSGVMRTLIDEEHERRGLG